MWEGWRLGEGNVVLPTYDSDETKVAATVIKSASPNTLSMSSFYSQNLKCLLKDRTRSCHPQ